MTSQKRLPIVTRTKVIEYRVKKRNIEFVDTVLKKTVITCIIFLNYLYHMHIDIDKIHVVDAVVGSNWCTSY